MAKKLEKSELLSPAEHVAALVRLGVILEWCDTHIEAYYENYLKLNTITDENAENE